MLVSKVRKAVCFDMISPVIVRMYQVWESGQSNEPFSNQVNDAWSKGLNDCECGSNVGNQPFALTLKQRKSGPVFVIRSQVIKGGIRSENQDQSAREK